MFECSVEWLPEMKKSARKQGVKAQLHMKADRWQEC